MVIEQKREKFFGFLEVKKRCPKPRDRGLTMVLDRGIGLNHAEDLMEAEEYIDIIKLGWTTPRLLNRDRVIKKIALYKSRGIRVCNGGTLLEIVCLQKKLNEFFDHALDTGIDLIEVSNGAAEISPEEKSEIISMAKERGFSVISEVGKKDPAEDRKLSLDDRVAEALSDIRAGAGYVIIEARESGKDLGIYDEKGSLNRDMAFKLAESIGIDRIMFEAPEKSQQAGLIMMFGSEINLGNIKPDDVIPLETLRRGIRGDTFGKV